MPRPPRVRFEGAYYHVYNRGVEKRPIFFENRDRRIFLRLLGEAAGLFGLSIFTYCLMENHFHLFLQTPSANLNQAMQRLQGQYAQWFNLCHNRVGPLFQGRYKSRLAETDSYSLTLIKYIHNNPVKDGLVASPAEYPWSSYGDYVGKSHKQSWLNTDWVLGQFDKEPRKARALFKVFHQVPEGSDPSGT